MTGFNTQPPYYWTQTTYRNGQPSFTSSFTTQDPVYELTVGEEATDLTVTARSTCDGQLLPVASRTVTPYVDPNGGFYCDPYSLRVAPNPANEYVEISTSPENGSGPQKPVPAKGQANPHAFRAQLHNDQGEEISQGATEDGRLRLTTRDLRPGLYHLVVRRGSQVIRRNLSIVH